MTPPHSCWVSRVSVFADEETLRYLAMWNSDAAKTTNDEQWTILRDLVCHGAAPGELVTGFIIDSPWLPNWCGVSIADYLAHDEVWFEANRRAVETFPSTAFFPGFWAEYGMCTDPSAFGTRCVFPENEFPFAHPVIRETDRIRGSGLLNRIRGSGLLMLPLLVK